MESASEVATLLLERAAVKVRITPPFQWASGIKSPVYCDNRIMISFPRERRMIVQGFKRLIEEKGMRPDVIGGTATAAIPWAAFLAYELDLPMIYIRPEQKEHGAGKQVEGSVDPHQRVLIVEDLVSTGGSSVKAAEAVRRELDAIVEDVIAIVSWELAGAEERFSQAGLRLSTLTGYSALMDAAVASGALSADQRETVMEFKKDPAGWGERIA